MKIAVYEHISGGGYADKPLSATILAEGYSMLKCVAADFKAAGHQVTVVLDERIANLNPPLKADHTVTVSPGSSPAMFLPKVAEEVDSILIIAPETAKTLQTLVKLAESTCKSTLNATQAAIAKVSDKSALYSYLQKVGVAMPKTAILKKTDNPEFVKQTVETGFLYPVIFKPTDGTSCGGISLVRSRFDVEKALNKIKTESTQDNFLIQEYISGLPASVSLICNGKKSKAISLNKQTVNLNAPSLDSYYQGGFLPLQHQLMAEAYAVAEKTADLFQGLRGYICVDVILGENRVYVLDLNPRLTTSYVGLREVSNENFGQALITAVTEGKLPQDQPFKGVCCFAKAQTPKPTPGPYSKALKMLSVVSPPFPFTDPAVAMLRTYGATLEEAAHRLEEAKKTLRSIIC